MGIAAQLTLGGVAGEILMGQAACVVAICCGLPESTTLPVKLNGPADVGVPAIAPVVVFRFKPEGSDPDRIENVYGTAPPVGASPEE